MMLGGNLFGMIGFYRYNEGMRDYEMSCKDNANHNLINFYLRVWGCLGGYNLDYILMS